MTLLKIKQYARGGWFYLLRVEDGRERVISRHTTRKAAQKALEAWGRVGDLTFS